jgi:hypothetical protein
VGGVISVWVVSITGAQSTTRLTAVRGEEAAVRCLDDGAEGHALKGKQKAVVGGEAQLGEALLLEAEEARRAP